MLCSRRCVGDFSLIGLGQILAVSLASLRPSSWSHLIAKFLRRPYIPEWMVLSAHWLRARSLPFTMNERHVSCL
jgi:hypothetical protein